MPSGNPTFFAPPGERMGHRWSQQEENYVFARFSHGDSMRDIADQTARRLMQGTVKKIEFTCVKAKEKV